MSTRDDPSARTHGRRVTVAAAVAALLLAGCSITVGPAESGTEPVTGATTPTTTTPPTTTTLAEATRSSSVAAPWPPGRRGHAMVALEEGRLLVVGGLGVAGGSRVYLADVWEHGTAGGEWRPTAEGPVARSQHAMAHDPTSGTTVVFGGYVGGEFTYGDTWLRDADGAWQRIEGPGPSARAGAVATYDAGSGLIVLFGGAERPPLAELPLPETWVFDVATRTWEQRNPAVAPELRSEGHPTLFELAMTYDAQSDRVILLIGGEQTWAYDTDADAWERRSDPGLDADYMVAAAYDATVDRVVTHGGAPTDRTRETWLYDYDRDRWEWIPTPTSPGTVGDHTMAFDPVTGLTYLFGGGRDLLSLDGPADRRDSLWAFDGEDWRRIGP